MKARGKEDAHRRQDEPADDSRLPEIGMDYDIYGDTKEGEKHVTTLVTKDRKTGVIFGHAVESKGASDTWVTAQTVKDIETLGRRNIQLRTDGGIETRTYNLGGGCSGELWASTPACPFHYPGHEEAVLVTQPGQTAPTKV